MSLSEHPPTPDDSHPRGDPRDRLTILRILLLTTGVAVGITVFAPQVKPGESRDGEWWLYLANALMIGLSLPAPLFIVRFRRMSPAEVGPGGLFALMSSLGVLLLMPPAIVARIISSHSTVPGCLYYVLPLTSVWFVLASILTGGARRAAFGRATPWTERYGFFLAVFWSPLGVWHVVEFYREAFGRFF